MSRTKTFLLAPNFTYTLESGSIRLGSIIGDSLQPAAGKLALMEVIAEDTETVDEYDYKISRDHGSTVQGGIRARFVQAASASTTVVRDRHNIVIYNVETLTTHRLREIPTEKQLLKYLEEPPVRAFLNSWPRPPLYLISGLKVATGLTVRTESARATGGGVAADASVGPDGTGLAANIGADVNAHRQSHNMCSFKGGDKPVIFAYEMLAIRVKGRSLFGRSRNGTVEVNQHEPPAALLDEDSGKRSCGDEIENAEVKPADMVDVGEGAGEDGFWVLDLEPEGDRA
ncbi:hypothetical protein G7054_g8804 [Neopestalotiopsis clavispora]|nr:hypothetical protein G7054_g8804 [Neopestalotiopsis clavispora]